MKKIYLAITILSLLFLVGCSVNSNDQQEETKSDEKVSEEPKTEEPLGDKCAYDAPENCDKSCTKNEECKPLTPKACINVNEENASDISISFYSLPDCTCENNQCEVVEENPTKSFSAADLAGVDPNFSFQVDIPENWQAEYVADSQAINFYDPQATGENNLEKSQVFVKYFSASSFQTLNTVYIFSEEELTINDRPAVRYNIMKKRGIDDFPNQPAWRSDQHFVTDIRSTDDNPTIFYVFARRPDLDETEFTEFIYSVKFK
ncbi:hypothetical protein KJ903_05560 [Patescibacteria group bacterium]|nr:hypothetical protein [Patescibacteria group bacterium]